MICGKCGSQMPDHAVFCGNCGNRIDTVPDFEITIEDTDYTKEAEFIEIDLYDEAPASPCLDFTVSQPSDLIAPVIDNLDFDNDSAFDDFDTEPLPTAPLGSIPAPQHASCANCGAALAAGSLFCRSCGTKVSYSISQQPKEKKSKKKLAITLCTLAVIAVIAVILIFVFQEQGRSAEQTVQQYMDAMLDADGSKVFSLAPQEIFRGYSEQEKESICRNLSQKLSKTMDRLKSLAVNPRFTYSIQGETTVTGNELKNTQALYKKLDLTVTEAKVYQVQIICTADNIEIDEKQLQVYVIKIGSNWYIDFNKAESIL